MKLILTLFFALALGLAGFAIADEPANPCDPVTGPAPAEEVVTDDED